MAEVVKGNEGTATTNTWLLTMVCEGPQKTWDLRW